MRHTIALAALLALIAVSTARAEEWCGFIDKEGAPVHCGYSSLEQCKQSTGDKKDAYCMPDPGFASLQSGRVKLASNAGE